MPSDRKFLKHYISRPTSYWLLLYVADLEVTTRERPSSIIQRLPNDIDHDGSPDIISAGFQSNTIAIYGTGNGQFGDPQYIPAGTTPTHVQAADLNGDGNLQRAILFHRERAALPAARCRSQQRRQTDFVVTGEPTLIYLNQGNTAFTLAQQISPARGIF